VDRSPFPAHQNENYQSLGLVGVIDVHQ